MKTILLVEDEKNQQLLYQEELTKEGYNVIFANDGEQALAKFHESSADLVILDIRMPGMDGVETLGKMLSSAKKKVPIIINTAYASYKENFGTWSADAYIVKSADLTELKSKIKELL